eukprot:Opistho-2@69986
MWRNIVRPARAVWRTQRGLSDAAASRWRVNADPTQKVPRESLADASADWLKKPLTAAVNHLPHKQNIHVPHIASDTRLTILPNGIRVASTPTFGQFATVGVFMKSGARFERDDETGVAHFADRIAFKSTHKRTQAQLVDELVSLGGNASCSSSRDTIVYSASVFASDLDRLVEILADSVTNAQITTQEVDELRSAIYYERDQLDTKAPSIMPELIHQAAYNGKGLGHSLCCPRDRVDHVTAEDVRAFVSRNYTAPRMTIAAAGCDHAALVDLAHQHFGHLPKGTTESPMDPPAPPSPYVGGDVRMDGESDWTHLALAFESVPFVEDDFYPMSVLQVMMGGGDSFSAGGPGKGMYSRLYLEVLNQYAWMESSIAVHAAYSDTAVFGVQCSASPKNALSMVRTAVDQLRKIKKRPGPVELNRAKAMLRSLVLMNLESRSLLADDMGRQVLWVGKCLTASDICANIEKVTGDDIIRVASRVLKSRPTVAAFGDCLDLPPYEVIEAWLRE